MKKTYQTPIVRLISIKQRFHLLAGSGAGPNYSSPNTIRNSAGDPTGSGLGISIFSSGDDSDGSTTRSREWFGDDDW